MAHTTTTPNLSDYDLIVVNTSAGKDSQVTLDEIVRRAKAEGVLDRVVAVHATFPEEWAGTEELARRQAEFYGVECHVVSSEAPLAKDGLLARVEHRGMWMGQARFCTSDMKRDPIHKWIRNATPASMSKRLGRKVRVLSCMGIRAAESSKRSEKRELAPEPRCSNSVRSVDTYFPIFNMSADQVWNRIAESGCPSHDAYKLGMPRLSCVFCVYAPKAALMVAGKANPELLDRYVETEKKIGHKFTAKTSIESIRDAIAAGEEPGEIKTWEM